MMIISFNDYVARFGNKHTKEVFNIKRHALWRRVQDGQWYIEVEGRDWTPIAYWRRLDLDESPRGYKNPRGC